MANAQKRITEDSALNTEEMQEVYSELSRALMERRNEILPLEQQARIHLDEQILDTPGDDADASILDESADYFLHLANNHQRELIEVAEALDRLHRGAYGICESCSNEISIARLRHLPAARMCIECQAARERGTSHLRATAFKPTF